MGLEIPSVYLIFHEFFFKSSIGDAQWKVACLEAKDPTERLGPVQSEAFANARSQEQLLCLALDG